MLHGFPQKDSRYTDPEEALAGRCLTCGTVVSCLRKDATKGAAELGAWGDLLSTECQGQIGRKLCRARVFLMSATELRATVKELQ